MKLLDKLNSDHLEAYIKNYISEIYTRVDPLYIDITSNLVLCLDLVESDMISFELLSLQDENYRTDYEQWKVICGTNVFIETVEELYKDILFILGKLIECNSCSLYFYKDIGNFRDYCKSCIMAYLRRVPEDNCSICMESLSEYPCWKTSCNHYFHIRCFNKMKRNEVTNCPMCRKDICSCNYINII